LADQQTNPDGSVRSSGLIAQYNQYLALRGMVTGIGLQLGNVNFEGLHISAFACREFHQPGRIEISLVLHSGNWPETVKALVPVIVEPAPAPTVQAGSWWFDDAIHSGQILTW
jgi:hypothetical protein